MVNLNMIDTIGSGIKRMFTKQRRRYFPMPDYDLSEPKRVKVRIIGKVIDEKYTRMLMARTDLDPLDVIALDKVQKGIPLTERVPSLKGRNSSRAAARTCSCRRRSPPSRRRAEYIRNRASTRITTRRW